MSKEAAQRNLEEHRPRVERRCPQILCLLKGMPEKQMLEPKFLTEKHRDTYLPNTLAEGGGKCMQDVYCRGDPFREFVVTIPGLSERGELVSKDGKDGVGGIAGLKGGKERMRGKVFVGLSFVSFQRRVENGHKVGL